MELYSQRVKTKTSTRFGEDRKDTSQKPTEIQQWQLIIIENKAKQHFLWRISFITLPLSAILYVLSCTFRTYEPFLFQSGVMPYTVTLFGWHTKSCKAVLSYLIRIAQSRRVELWNGVLVIQNAITFSFPMWTVFD